MIELCISHAKQSVSGTDISFALAGVTGNATSNTANSFNLPSAGSRFELNESYQQACQLTNRLARAFCTVRIRYGSAGLP